MTLRLPLAFTALLLSLPLWASPFVVFQIGAQALGLGCVALSLSWLMSQAGAVSLAQLSVAGVAGYGVALLGGSEFEPSRGWPWTVAVPLALLAGVAAGAALGWLAARTEGLQTIMLTLAVAVAWALFLQQNQVLTNGFNGITGTRAPTVWGVDLSRPTPFYLLSLAVAAACVLVVQRLYGTVFGLTLRGARDDARKMAALGYQVQQHRIAAYAFAGLVASLGGVLRLWFNGQISSGSMAMGPVIDILVIAVIGGTRYAWGPFAGALVFVLLQNFAGDIVSAERFRLFVGVVFLILVLATRDGLAGLWDHWRGGVLRQRGVHNL